MPKVTVFDRARGGLVDVDPAINTVTAYLRANLDGTYTPTTNAADPLVIQLDPTTLVRVAQRQLGTIIDAGVTYRTRDPLQIAWTDRTTSLTIANSDLTGGTYGPLVNGRYRISLGSLRSTVPGVPAVMVTATLPITFVLMNFWGWGMDAYQKTGMVYGGTNSDMRFEECLGLSGKPPAGYDGAMPAFFVVSENGANLEVANCEYPRTRGINVVSFRNPSVSGRAGGGVRVQRVVANDIDGRRVDATGNWDGRTKIGNVVQFQNCQNLTSDSFVEDYISRQDPVYAAEIEDAVSTYNSFCAPGQNVIFRRFLVENNMPTDAAFAASGGTLATIGSNGSGGSLNYGGTGGLMGDNQGITVTASNVGQGFTLRDGTVLNVANYGGAIQSGHNNLIDNVTVISHGFIRSKAAGGYSRMAWTGGGGLHAWDRAVNNNDPSIWYGNIIRNSKVSYNLMNTSGVISRGSTPIWDNSNGGCTFTNNTINPVPANVAAALAELDAARAAQMKVWSDAGTVIGLSAAAPVSTLKISTDPAA